MLGRGQYSGVGVAGAGKYCAAGAFLPGVGGAGNAGESQDDRRGIENVRNYGSGYKGAHKQAPLQESQGIGTSTATARKRSLCTRD